MNRRLAVLGNALLYTVSNLAEYAIGLLVSIVIARTLGPHEFGVFSFAVWLAGTLFFFGNHGTTLTTIRFTAEAFGEGDPAKARAHAAVMGRVQTISVLLLTAGFVALAWWQRPEYWQETIWVFIGIVAVSVLTKSRYSFLHGIALGAQRYSFAAAAPVASALVYLGAALVVKTQAPSTPNFLAAYALSCVAGYAVIAVLLRRAGLHPQAGPVPADQHARLMKNMWLTAALAMLAVATTRTIETFVLSGVGSAADIGFFAISVTITKGAVDILTAGLQSTLLPVMAHAKGRSEGRDMSPMVNTAVRYYWFIGLLVAGAGAYAARPLVLLVYGQPYEPAVLPVQLALVGAGLSLVSAVIGAFLTTQDRQDDRVRAAAWTLAINAVLAAALVPWLGLLGAAATFAAVRVAGALLALGYFMRSATVVLETGPCLRMLGAAALAAGVAAPAYAWLPDRWGGALAAALLVLLFTVLSVVLRSWSRADFQLARSLLAKLGRARLGERLQRIEARFASDVQLPSAR